MWVPKLALPAIAMFAATAFAQGSPADLAAALSNSDAALRAVAYETAAKHGPEAISAVAPLLNHENPAVVRAAKLAIEKIAGAASTPETARQTASRALCRALFIVQSEEGRRWLFWLVSYTCGPEAVDSLSVFLDNPETFDHAVFALQSIGGPESVNVLARKLAAASLEQRVAMLIALGAIRDASAVQTLLTEAKKPEPDCIPAIEALGRIGGKEALKAVSAAIRRSANPRIADAYLRLLEQQSGKLAAKGYANLLKTTQNPKLQCAALRGLGKTAKAGSAKDITRYLAAERADVAGAARAALVDLPGAAVDRKLTSLLRKAQPDAKSQLLEVLYARSPDSVRPILEEAVQSDPTVEVKAAALELLARTMDSQYESLYLEGAQQSDDSIKTAAVHGYLKLAAKVLGDGDRYKALEMYHRSLDLAGGVEEKRLALQGLTQIASPDTLLRLQNLADNQPPEELRLDLGRCALAIADALRSSDRDLALQVYNAVLDRAAFRELSLQAADGLRALGITVDAKDRYGYITRWKLVGPFLNMGFQTSYPPEVEFKPKADYAGVEGRRIRWTDLVVTDVQGCTDLAETLKPNENVIAYACAEVTVTQAQDVILKIGSDDGVICWLNGAKIHEHDVARRLQPDNDTVPAKLKAGKNILLMKIVQGGGGWGFCARLTTPDGKPLRFEN